MRTLEVTPPVSGGGASEGEIPRKSEVMAPIVARLDIPGQIYLGGCAQRHSPRLETAKST